MPAFKNTVRIGTVCPHLPLQAEAGLIDLQRFCQLNAISGQADPPAPRAKASNAWYDFRCFHFIPSLRLCSVIMLIISRSVSRMPIRPSRLKLAMEFPTPFTTSPSPS